MVLRLESKNKTDKEKRHRQAGADIGTGKKLLRKARDIPFAVLDGMARLVGRDSKGSQGTALVDCRERRITPCAGRSDL